MKTLLLSFSIFFFLLGLTLEGQVPERVGWWKFDSPVDVLAAEIGSPLQIIGTQTPVDGPVAGNKAIQVGVGSYLSMSHGISPNGGGALVNEYSLQIDFSVTEVGIWHSFFQTDPTNAGDADLFTNTSGNAIGTSATTYTSRGIAVDTWYRMIVSVRNGEFFRVYINGTLWLDGADQGMDGRYSLSDVLLLFADNDGEDGVINCSEAAIWDIALDEYQVMGLGDAAGNRPLSRTKLGWWKFDNPANLLEAEIGNPLEIIGTQESVSGPEAGNNAVTIGVGSYLKLTDGMLANGGGSFVNEYSIQIDFLVPETGISHSFYQTEVANTTDGELFSNKIGNTIGTAATGFSTSGISANNWYRMVITVKNGEFFRVYLNGELWLEAPGQPIDGRWGLADAFLLFADNDGDDGTVTCSEVSIWEVALTVDEVLQLGSDPSNKIPARVGWWKFDDPADLLKAEIGSPLELTGVQMEATGPLTGNNATSISTGSYLSMYHGIYGNGGGMLANEYSLQIDFSVPEAGTWHSFFQTNPLNTDDADLFTNGGTSNPNTIGTSSTGYTANSITANTWYRMLLSVKNGMFFRIYMNGEIWLEAAGQSIDGRWALPEQLLMFADNDGEDGTIICSELGIWDVALNPDQAVKMGDATTTLSTGAQTEKGIGNSLSLGRNYPNPFTTSTTLPYHIQKSGNVSFSILDLTGNTVMVINEGMRTAGSYKLELNAEKLKSGIYFIRLTTGDNTIIRKISVIR